MSNEKQDAYAAAFPETAAFWAAAARSVFLIPECKSCGKSHWFPRAHCPFCYSDAVTWKESGGTATVFSWTVTRRTGSPYVVAYVELDEGPILLTNIVECDPDHVHIGMPVSVTFKQAPEGRFVPIFRPK